jgi:hypothetical protein
MWGAVRPKPAACYSACKIWTPFDRRQAKSEKAFQKCIPR